MIKLLQNENMTGVIVSFGDGAVRIENRTQKSQTAGQVEFNHIKALPPGEIADQASELISESPRVVLNFENIQAIDILVSQLESLKIKMEKIQKLDELRKEVEAESGTASGI